MLTRSAGAAAFSRDGDRVAVADGDGIRILDRAGRALATVPRTSPADHLAWSPDDTRIAVSGSSDVASVDVIDVTDPPAAVERRLQPSHRFTSPAVWSPSGAQLAIERNPF